MATRSRADMGLERLVARATRAPNPVGASFSWVKRIKTWACATDSGLMVIALWMLYTVCAPLTMRSF